MSMDSAPVPSIWYHTPTFGVVRAGIAGGFRWLSVALAVYAGSAALVFAFTIALLTALAVAGWMFSRSPSIFGPVVLALSGAAAIAFLTAVLLPLHALVAQNRRTAVWIVAALSITAIMAEVIVPMG